MRDPRDTGSGGTDGKQPERPAPPVPALVRRDSPGPTIPPSRADDPSPNLLPQSAAFAPGSIAAERFRALRFLARGGMGEVYEAEDAALGERVALKTIRSEIAADPDALARFKQEIQLARRVTHPNVSRVFDFWVDPVRGPFVTMELLVGETLEERIVRSGRLSTDEALPIVRQMISGLAAAHTVGVIHRNFKSGNVMLAAPDHAGLPREGDAPREEIARRAVVTDFGLALALSARRGHASDAGRLIGSPGYMAPEKVEGGEVTPATDIYALGVVLFEMLTGAMPFAGDSAEAIAHRRLSEPPPSPRALAPDLGPRWEQAIARCLALAPEDRFATANEVLEAITGESARPARRRSSLVLAVVAASVMVAAVVGLEIGRRGEHRRGQRGGGSPDAPSGPRASVAVLGFRNMTGHDANAWLSTAFSEMFARELSAGERLRPMPGDDVEQLKAELGLADAESLSEESLARLRGALSADYVLCGAFDCQALSSESALTGTSEISCSSVRVAVRLQEAVGGKTIATLTDTSAAPDLGDLVARTSAALRDRLGIVRISSAEAGEVRSAYPANAEAARAYAEGVRLVRQRELIAARRQLEASVAADPDFALGRSELSQALAGLGYDEKARQEAREALERSAGLARKDRLFIEARYHATAGDWQKAAEIYRSLWVFHPDQPEFGLSLAEAQRSGGMNVEALATLDSLRTLPPPTGNDPRLDLAEAAVTYSLSDYTRSKAAAARAAEQAGARGLRTIVARARRAEGNAVQEQGDLPGARVLLEESARLCEEARDRGGLAAALTSLGTATFATGELENAAAQWERALAIARDIGNLDLIGNQLNNLAVVKMRQKDVDAAEKLFEEALVVQREAGDKAGQFSPLLNLAGILDDRGDHAGGRRKTEEALAVARDVGDRRREAIAINNIAMTHRQEGNLTEARRLMDQSLAIQREIGSPADVAGTLNALGIVMRAIGDLKDAVRAREECLALFRQVGDKPRLPTALSGLAVTLLLQGDVARAGALADEAVAASRALGDAGSLALALSAVAGVAASQDDLPAARVASSEALALHEKRGAMLQATELRLDLARLAIEEGRARDAIPEARDAAAAARERGEVDLEMAARVVQTEALLKDGKTADAEKSTNEARALGARSQNKEMNFASAIATGRVQSALGRAAEAAESLEGARRGGAARVRVLRVRRAARAWRAGDAERGARDGTRTARRPRSRGAAEGLSADRAQGRGSARNMNRAGKETVGKPSGAGAARDTEVVAARGAPALIVAWSTLEPDRAGEVIHLEESARVLVHVLGRYDSDYDYDAAFLTPMRQRPGVDEPADPLDMPQHVSRRQLEFARDRADRLRVTNTGKARVVLNGAFALDAGASAFLVPGDTLAIEDSLLLMCAMRSRRLEPLRHYQPHALHAFGKADENGIVGESATAWRLRDTLAVTAQLSQHVLVVGPTGSGKEHAARAIHAMSLRAKRPLVSHNAAGIPAALIEAELFGNRQDYPNPGTPGRVGLIGAADGSTLFLDELGQLSHELQGKLLRVLDEEGEYRRLGVDEALHSRFRLVAATNRPAHEIKHDLLARLKVTLVLPTLDERREDIPLIATHLLRRMLERDGDREVVRRYADTAAGAPGRPSFRCSVALIDVLVRHRYSANVRELEKLLVVSLTTSVSDRAELTRELRDLVGSARDAAPAGRDARATVADPAVLSCEVVRDALIEHGWNLGDAARALGWSRDQLYRKMKKCGLAKPAAR